MAPSIGQWRAAAVLVATTTFFAAATAARPTDQPPDHSASPSHPLPLSFAGDWETGNISQWSGAQCANYVDPRVPGLDRGNLHVVSNRVSQGAYAAKFDLPASSNRAACEAVRKRTLNLGADEYYGLDIRFPTGWREPSPHGWGMAIAQFNYQGIWSTPVGLLAHRDHVKLVVYSGYCRDVYSSNPGCTYQSGVGGNLPAKYAIPRSRFAAGVWHQLLIHVRWTTADNGIVEAWHRRQGKTRWVKTVTQRGYPTVQWKDGYNPHPQTGSVDKIGAYRGPARFRVAVWHDTFVVGTSREIVAAQLR